MVKRKEWYAHFVLKKNVELLDEPETVTSTDKGAQPNRSSGHLKKLSRQTNEWQWRGEEIERLRGLYGHIKRKLQKKHNFGEIKHKERRKVNQQLHIIANQIIEYVKQFPEPLIVMEDLNGIRKSFKTKKLNKRFHLLPFRKLQTIIEYKASLECILVRCLTKKEVKNTSKTCHSCGHVPVEHPLSRLQVRASIPCLRPPAKPIPSSLI